MVVEAEELKRTLEAGKAQKELGVLHQQGLAAGGADAVGGTIKPQSEALLKSRVVILSLGVQFIERVVVLVDGAQG